LPFERRPILKHFGGNERIRVCQVLGNIKVQNALNGPARADDRLKRGPQLFGFFGFTRHFKANDYHGFTSIELLIRMIDIFSIIRGNVGQT
jgi:hypothetical protein